MYFTFLFIYSELLFYFIIILLFLHFCLFKYTLTFFIIALFSWQLRKGPSQIVE